MTDKRRRRTRRLRRTVFLLVGLVLCFQVVWWTEPLVAFALLERLAPNVVWRVPTDQPLVALSFDDGPDPVFTPQVLDLLKEHDAYATFFLIGDRARAHPKVVEAIKAGGHEVANHYHVRGTTLLHNRAEFVNYLDRAEQAIGLAPGPKLFRPPGGIAWPSQTRLARDRGYTCVLGSAYPHDPARPPARYIRWLIEKNMVPGTIVILHDGISDPSRSLEALPHVLATAGQRGVSFVSVGTLLAAALTPPNEAMHQTGH